MQVGPIVALGRRIAADTYLDTCVIADRTEVRDKSGGKRSVWTDRTITEHEGDGGGKVRTHIRQPCRFLQLTDETPRIESGQMFGIPTAMWTAPLGTEISEGDRITNLLDNSKWIVTSNLTAPSMMAIMVRCGIRRAEKGEAE